MTAWTPADGAELDALVQRLVVDYWEHRKRCEACRPEPCPVVTRWHDHKSDCRACRGTHHSSSAHPATPTERSLLTAPPASGATRARTYRRRSASLSTGGTHGRSSHAPKHSAPWSRPGDLGRAQPRARAQRAETRADTQPHRVPRQPRPRLGRARITQELACCRRRRRTDP